MTAIKKYISKHYPCLYHHLLNLRTILTLPFRPILIRKYLADHTIRKLQLGSGRYYFEGWLNSDYYAKHPKFIHINACKPLPLPSNSIDIIFSEQMVEHIPYDSFIHMLCECRRVLKTNGKIRIETPDLERICALYSHRDTPESQGYIEWNYQHWGDKRFSPSACNAINSIMRQYGHLYIYDKEMLISIFQYCGFKITNFYGWGETNDPDFLGLSVRGDVGGTKFETIAVEATKA